MERKIIATKDGSHTVMIPEMNVTYHSIHGAIQESQHVFIQSGLLYLLGQSTNQPGINILEMGFGTGLNAQLTLAEAEKHQVHVFYHALELFPLEKEKTDALNYCTHQNKRSLQAGFEQLHSCDWGKKNVITPFFTLLKNRCSLIDFSTDQRFHLIYFDAFAPAAQPELWTKNIFEKMYSVLVPKGILVTYCSKGEVKRTMQSAGFQVEKIAGPPGKREIIRAKKQDCAR